MAYDPTTWEHGDIITGGKLNKIEKELTRVGNNATFGFGGAQLSSDGLTPLSYINTGDPMPSNPKKGDTVFVKDGNDFLIYSYNGEEWVPRINPNLTNRLQENLDAANAATDKAIETNNTKINETINQVAKEQADLAIKNGDFNNKAQAMADKALADAKANTATTAQNTMNSANQNIAAAKKDLTDGLAKEISDRTKAVTDLNDTAQNYANQAKADALNAVTKEATDRQNAASALDTKATNAVNQAKSDIADTINAISVGGRNYILDTANPKTQTSNGKDNQDIFNQASFYSPIKNWGIANGNYVISFDWTLKTALSSDMQAGVFLNKPLYQGTSFIIKSGQISGHVNLKISLWDSSVSSESFGLTFRINSQMDSGNTITYSKIKMESGTVATDWTPAPEDVVLDYTTKDNQIKETITQYQTTNDGKVIKAQTDATTALGEIATKVSQTDYNTKTGDLDTKYTTVKQTVDSQAADIVDIKKTASSQASKINSISSDVDGTKQSISDIETTQDSQSDKINQITSDVNGTKQSITDIQTKDANQDTRMGTIETSVSGVKSDFSTYKTTNDGKVSTAQTTAQTAVDGLKTKVSQTDYNTKTGQLQTDLTSTTQTANQAKTDIVSIKETDGRQDARMTQIESDASGTKTTVSNIQTTQGKQSGDISTLQQRADGFDATVTKVQNQALNINLVVNSEFDNSTGSYTGWHVGNPWGTTVTKEINKNGNKTKSDSGSYLYPSPSQMMVHDYSSTADWVYSDPIPIGSSQPLSGSLTNANPSGASTNVGLALYVYAYDSNRNKISAVMGSNLTNIHGNWIVNTFENKLTPPNTAYVSFCLGWNNGKGYFGQPMLQASDKYTGYIPSSSVGAMSVANAQLTADNAALNLSKYQTDADGRISKAQADITTNANDITQKVSQADYDKKTGDLSTSVSKAQQTADSATTTIGNYKTSNDNRVKATETQIAQNTSDITLRATTADLNSAKSDYNAQIAQVKVDANSISQTVSQVDSKVDNLSIGGRNLLLDTSIGHTGVGNATVNGNFNAQGAVWNLAGGKKVSDLYNQYGETGYLTISFDWVASVSSGGDTISGSFNPQWTNTPWGGIANSGAIKPSLTNTSGHYESTVSLSLQGYSTGTATGIMFRQDNLRGTIQITNLKLESGNKTTDWTPAPEDTVNALASQKITIDGITDVVSNPTTGLSARVQTAEGTLSRVQGVDIPALQKATFWQPYSSLNFNDYQKQGSFFFNTTSAKTNGPTTSNAWIYLTVEQGTADNARIKQTAWYDGVNGVKITYVRTLNSGTWSPWYANDNDSVATITQTNSDIRQEITDRKTGDTNTLQSSKDFTQSSITSYDNGIQSQLTQTANGILAQVESTNMVVNSEFDPLNGTFYRLTNGGSTGSQLAEAWSPTQTSGFADWPVVNGSRVISYAVATWYSTALVAASAGKAFSASIVAGRAANPTVSTALDYRIGFWDSSKKLLATASAGNIIDGTAYKGIAKYVVENKVAPANTAFVSVIIAHSSANAIDCITRPSLNIGTKASPYTPTYGNTSSSTVLGLFKDNWSIGLADNIGKISSGIAADNSSMSIISDKVVIKSPNTQITGTAWINSAMIANASIQTINIADAAITSAKIAQLDVAKLTGNISSFIQSNWNGLYQSVKINPTGMTISTSQGSTAQFNQDGLVMSGSLGTTNVLNGQIELISSANEYLGTFQHETMPDHNNVDYLMIKLAGWHTGKSTDSDYDLNSDGTNTIRGGDGIGFGITNNSGTYDMLMSWDSSLVAGYKGRKMGWHVEDIMTWHQPAYFEGGFDVAQQFSSTDRRALHIQGATLSNGQRWYGFFDTPSQAGFGTDTTQDVIFYVKGKSYSLYTMLSKLNML